jgi:hypothetical protein
MEVRIKNLIFLLKNKTINKEAIWSRTSGENEFKIEFNNATITTDMWYIEDKLFYDFAILNENGDTIERISVNTLDSDYDDYMIISDFYDVIKNNYFKVDETIDSILIELNSSAKIGSNKKK